MGDHDIDSWHSSSSSSSKCGRRRFRCDMIWMVFLVGILLPQPCVGQRRWQYCRLSDQPVVSIWKNVTSGEFLMMDEVEDNETSTTTSNDSGNNPNDDRHLQRTISSLGGANNSIENEINGTEDVIKVEARYCFCSFYRRRYCELQWEDCGVPPFWVNEGEPECFTGDRKDGFARSVFGPLVLMWIVVFMCVLCTKMCCNMFDFAVQWFYPEWNLYVVNRIILNDPERANMMVSDYGHYRQELQTFRERRTLQQEEPQQQQEQQQDVDDSAATALSSLAAAALTPLVPDQLKLKTRIFQKDTNAAEGEDDDDDEEICTICCEELQSGDKVGDLQCCHVFHAECLKLWLKRKNVCPYCQRTQVACPVYNDLPAE